METIELSGRTGQEVYEELKHRLEGMGYLPDEYFLLDADWEDRRVIPRNADLFCTTDYGDSEGIYLDVYLKWYGEDGKPVIKSFATGKTLGESGSDMDRMFLISSAITKRRAWCSISVRRSNGYSWMRCWNSGCGRRHR